jgi:hypothetical protein
MTLQTRPFLVTVSVALLASFALAPAAPAADRGSGSFGRGFRSQGFAGAHSSGRHFAARPSPHSFGSRPFSHRHFRSFGGFGVIASPVVIYAAPSLGGYYDAPPDYGPPVAYGAPGLPGPGMVSTVSVAPAPPPAPAQPPAPSVVEFPTGRYELRGDGMSVPYAWVWVPNPPTAPPGSVERSASRHGQLFRWTDDQGVLNVTDRLEAVPPQYRAQAKQSLPL